MGSGRRAAGGSTIAEAAGGHGFLSNSGLEGLLLLQLLLRLPNSRGGGVEAASGRQVGPHLLSSSRGLEEDGGCRGSRTRLLSAVHSPPLS